MVGTVVSAVNQAAVGVLLSVVGYFSPLPPDINSEQAADYIKEEK